MATLIMILHVLVCFFLIAIVLLQTGKGAELGAAFGGSSQTLFGSRGAATFLNKITTISAIVFMVTSLSLAFITAKGGSVIKKGPVATEEQKTVPQTPAPPSGFGVQPDQSPAQGQAPKPAAPAK